MQMQNSEINDFLLYAGSWNPMRTKSKEPKKKKCRPVIQSINPFLSLILDSGAQRNLEATKMSFCG